MGERTDDMKGRMKEAAGDLTNNEDLEREGKIDQGKAEVKEKADRVTDAIGDKFKKLTD
ncbi:MAG TPA: CsbD family protein [Acidimicrobiales bacterium]|jgi:uncharacterized protein YjbJ (UPF0337 family)|nr:CsbD family protein [Acidimicrobiales bacterium]